MSKQDSAARAEAPEVIRAEQREKPQEQEVVEAKAEGPNVGEVVEHRRADGKTVKDVVIASGDDGTVLARKQGEGHVFLPLAPGELQARNAADRQLDLFEDAYGDAAKSAVKAAGMKGEAAQDAIDALEASKSAAIAGAMGEKDPEAAITQIVREHVDAIARDESEPATPTLIELQQKWREAKTKADGAKTDKEYADAMREVRAIESAVFNVRAGMHPQADTEQKAEIANQAEGAVEMTDDPLYDQGAEAVGKRIQELEETMKTADREKNEVLWMIAHNEYNNHRAVLPIIERINEVLRAQEEVNALVKSDAEKQRQDVTRAKLSARGKKGYWRAGEEDLKRVIRSIEDGMRAIDKGPSGDKTSAEYARLNEERQAKQAELKSINARVEEVSAQMEALKAAKIVDTSGVYASQFDEVNKGLVQTLRDTFKSSPETAQKFLAKALKDSKFPESTRVALQEAFGEQPKADKQDKLETIPKTSIQIGDQVKVRRSSGDIEDNWRVMSFSQEGRQVYVVRDIPDNSGAFTNKLVSLEKLLEVNTESAAEPQSEKPKMAEQPTIEMPKSFQPLSENEKSFKDLIKADILEEGGDLKALRESYNEVLFALNKVGMDPKDEGIPESFDQLMNIKDERGFFGKLFKKETTRVKLIKKMFDLHYQYIDSGQVDISEYKNRMLQQQEEYRRKMATSGGRT